MPERFQARRTKGWRKPEGGIVVTRPHLLSNPFRVGDRLEWSYRPPDDSGELLGSMVITQEMAVLMFADLMDERLSPATWANPHPDDVAWTQGWRDALDRIAGHDLGCSCPLDQPCHVDVLLRLANG